MWQQMKDYIGNHMSVRVQGIPTPQSSRLLTINIPSLASEQRHPQMVIRRSGQNHLHIRNLLTNQKHLSNLVQRALLLPLQPLHDALSVKLAQALQPRQLYPHIIFHHADRALLLSSIFIDAILLRSYK